MGSIPITRKGYESLKQELANLKAVERPEIIKAIKEARAHGDLSENAEYHAAKERQSFLEGRINELSCKIAELNVIDTDSLSRDRAIFGCTVILENLDTGGEVTYQLVGPDESDINNGLISITSPLGKALLGKSPGDGITLQAPGGQKKYELVEIL